MSLTPTNKSNPCQVCEDTAGKCRQGREDQDYWQCMTYPDSCKGEIVNGFKSLGHTRDQLWGQFKLDNSQEWSEQQRLEWQRENQRRRQEKTKADDERQRRSLTAVQRHEQYTRLLSELTLHPDDRADLVRRGFTHEQIELAGFKSIGRYHQLQSQYSELLPGISRGNRLIIADEGYLCPVRNADGLLVACQVRLRTLPTTETNRYRWLSGGGQTLHLYPEGCKSEGELPLPVFRPQGKPEGIALAEGTGAKPFLVSQRLNLFTIGAAGGQWASSPQLFHSTLEKAEIEVGTKSIKIFPDAGDVFNPCVMSRWQRAIALLEEWGWEVAVGWWNQRDKSCPDIDELDSLEAIEFITPKRFWDICNHTRQQAERDEKLRQERLKREAEDAIYEKLTTIQEKPWKVINTPQINLQELLTEPGAIYIVSSAKGTHKTNALIPVVASHDRVLAWFNRVALGREECNRIGVTWKDDVSSYGNKNKRGFCADSSFQFDPKVLSSKGLLLGDECDQVFAHMFGSTCNQDGKRPLILATLEAHIDAAIHGGGMALFMSADVTQRDIDYLKALAPEGCPVRLIVNEYEPLRGKVFFDMSENPDGKVEELLMTLEAGTPCFLIDDIKNGVKGCKSIAEYVRTVHPEWSGKIVEINSDTSGDPFIIDYLKNINKASKETLLLACSPSVVSGISIQNGHFGGVFALLNGILTVSDASQAIARVRGAEEIHLWAAEEGLAYEANHSTDPDEIKDWYRRNYEANCKHLLSFQSKYEPITGEWGSPHFDLFCKNAAYRNLCMSRLRERLQTRLIDEGYDVIIQEDAGSDMVKEALKDSWHKIELTEAYALANANILSEAELEALQFKTIPLTPEEKLDLQKTLLLKWFGQKLIDATTYEHDSGVVLTGYAAMALKNERGVYRQRLENFYLLASDEGEAIGKDIAAEMSQLKHNQGRFPGDIRWRSRQRKARAWLGLPQFLNPEKWYEPNDYRTMGQKAKSKAPMIKDCLNLTVDNISDGQIFGELMCQLGLELDKEWATVKPGQRRFKRRRISASSWKFAQMYVEYQQQIKAEREASASPQLSHEGVCQSDHPPQNIYTDSFFRGGVITEESQVEQVEMFTLQLDGSIQLCDNAVCDGDCVNLITPPSIYSETSFLGGGDQDLSQGVDEPSGELVPTAEEVAEAMAYCELPTKFVSLVQGYPLEIVEAAIRLQPDQPRRRELWKWWEQLQISSVQTEVSASVERGWGWGITRQQAEQWGASFEWIRGGLVQISYAAADFVKLASGQYVPYQHLRIST